MTGVFGGMFDPPHNGHVAVVAGADHAFAFDRMLILVAADPGHRSVQTPVAARLALAQRAFPDYDVEVDEHPRTIDMLRARRLDDPVLIVGADELEQFPTWKEPEAVLAMARLAVAARPGHRVETTNDRVVRFEIEPQAVSSTEIRRRVAAGESIDDLVPPAVASEIERLSLYRD